VISKLGPDAYEPRQRGYRLIPVGIPHMHYGRLGDTPMFSGSAEAYKSVSNEARQEAGPGRGARIDRRMRSTTASAIVTQREGGSVL
jgi:hypothetical protein